MHAFFLLDHTTFKCCSKWFKLFSSSDIFLKFKMFDSRQTPSCAPGLEGKFFANAPLTYQLKVAHWLVVHWYVVSARMNDTEINVLVRNTSADVNFRFREAPEQLWLLLNLSLCCYPLQPAVNWVVSVADRERYDELFKQTDTDGDGLVNGTEVIEIFMQSSLSQTMLAQIWWGNNSTSVCIYWPFIKK